tara:strand:+ start:310 stop:672 length:363 start_codon:yes stop_codon:yes gene_type:complete
MKSNEFKKILKPLIKQTVKEVLFEEGVLSKIVAEVATGLKPTIVETRKPTSQDTTYQDDARRKRIDKLKESTKFKNVFEGTQPLQENSHSALQGVSAGDAGVDISDIQKMAAGKWKHLLG